MSRQKNASLPGAESLLQTKLMPPRLSFSAIPRDNLLERLDRGLGRKLTLLTSPTGFGKTTLVSMWLANRDFPAAWVTLDENDNDPSRFWTYFVSAVRRFNADVGKTTLSALNAPQLSSWHSV